MAKPQKIEKPDQLQELLDTITSFSEDLKGTLKIILDEGVLTLTGEDCAKLLVDEDMPSKLHGALSDTLDLDGASVEISGVEDLDDSVLEAYNAVFGYAEVN